MNKLPNDKWLFTRLYQDKGLNAMQIADIFGVASQSVYKKMDKLGISRRSRSDMQRGERNHSWKGGIWNGQYVMLQRPDHPRANHRGYVPRSILVWESIHGPLPKDWCVHHKDSDKHNDSPENLEGMSHSEHATLTLRNARLLMKVPELRAIIIELEAENAELRRRLQ